MQSSRDEQATTESNKPETNKSLTSTGQVAYLTRPLHQESVGEIRTLERTSTSLVTLCLWHKTHEKVVVKEPIDKYRSLPAIRNEYAMLGTTLRGGPNIVPFRGGYIGTEYNSYVVTSFVANGSLRDFLLGGSVLTWGAAIQIMDDVRNALAFVHSKNVVHRDIKSANILIDSNLRAYLADFGSARGYNISGAYRSPQDTKMGTPGYRSPEAFESIHYAASDIYSFGIVMLEIASRRNVSKHIEDDVDAEEKWNEAIPNRVSAAISATIPKGIASLILNCCKTSREQRPSEKDILTTLEDCRKTIDLNVKITPRPL